MRRSFVTPRKRRLPPTRHEFKSSTIRKIASKSLAKTGNQALKIIPSMTIQRQQMFLEEAVRKRILTSGTTRALDMLKIYSTRKRAAIQGAMQEFQKAIGNTALERVALKKAHTQMTVAQFDRFIELLSEIRARNTTATTALIELRLSKSSEGMTKKKTRRKVI
jgi:hypothetical protein